MKGFADLHLHTVFSDGTYTPAQLIAAAKQSGLSCIALVDHDTVLGILPLLAAARHSGVEVLPGVEFSVEYKGLEVHILGYLIDYREPLLVKKLAVLRQNRVRRINKMLWKLEGLGIKLKPADVFGLAKDGTVGRMHVARAMHKAGFVKSTSEAFRKYIGDKCPAYVLDFKLSPRQAIRLIKGAGGIPVLAHPYLIKDDRLIATIIRQGIMGLEVYYPEHSPSMTRHYLGLAKEHGLLVTGGSDCHGSAKPRVKLGSVKVPYELVEKLKAARIEKRLK